MAISFTNSAISTLTTSGNSALTSYTVPTGVSELLIFIACDAANTSVPAMTRVQWNATNATLVSSVPVDAGGAGMVQYLYRILNPTAATGNIDTIHPSSVHYHLAVCVSITAAYTATVGTYNYAIGTAESVSSVSASGDSTLYFTLTNNLNPADITATASQTLIAQGGVNTTCTFRLDSKVSAGATNNATWTALSSQRWSSVALNYNESTATITSINGGSPITRGQTNIPIVTAGFTGTPVFTANIAGITFGATSGSNNSWTVSVSDFADSVLYPSLPVAITVTGTDGPKYSTLASNVTKLAAETKLVLSSPVYSSATYLGSVFAANAHTPVTNDEVYWQVISGLSGLVINADTGLSFATNGVLDCWHRVAADSKVYYYHVTISSGVIVSIIRKFSLGIGIGLGL